MKFGEVENHIIFNKIPERYTKNYIGNGTHGICYLLDKETVYKEISSKSVDPYSLKQFTFVDNDYFAFLPLCKYLFQPYHYKYS